MTDLVVCEAALYRVWKLEKNDQKAFEACTVLNRFSEALRHGHTLDKTLTKLSLRSIDILLEALDLVGVEALSTKHKVENFLDKNEM